MKKFLRENPTIAFGLGLPLLLVVIFLLISGIPAFFVPPPQYDVLYASEYNNYPPGVRITVANQQLQVTYQGSSLGYQNPRLWRFNPKTGAVKEIAIMLPPSLTPVGQGVVTPEMSAQVTPISVPDLAELKIDSSSIAPDGYEFRASVNGYSNGIFTGLFYSPGYRNDAVLTKNGRSIHLPNADHMYYSNNTHFIGWVVSP